MEEFIQTHKGYDKKRAIRAAYQTRIMLRSFLYTFLIILMSAFMGHLKSALISFVFIKFFRGSSGGIHVKGYFKCFILSFLILSSIVVAKNVIPLNNGIEVFIWIFNIVVWYLYVPQGTAQRPIVNSLEKNRMKYSVLIYGVVIFVLRFINFEVYTIGLFSFLMTMLLVLPPAYTLFQVQHNR